MSGIQEGRAAAGGEQPQQPHWGKRLREDSNTVRFSELSADQKMQRRRQERQEKKERDRTLAYFRSVQWAMDEHASGSDPTILTGIVEGFFSELLKLLKADPSFHLLRNGTVCRAIEAALGSAVLLQSKTLLYVLLGHIAELVTSPVASYTFETLMVSLSLGLSALAEGNMEGFVAEMTEGGPGIHTGSGVASTATLLRSMADELIEHAEDLLVHEVGARAVRSIVLVLGGYAIRNAPPPANPVRHTALVGTLAEAMVTALEEGYGCEYQAQSVAEAWLAAAQAPTTSFIVQSLLRVSVAGTPAYTAVVERLESLTYKGKALLWHFMTDRQLGSHLFQAYLRVPVPAEVIEAGDREALQLEHHRKTATSAASTSSSKGRGKKAKKAGALAGLQDLAEEKVEGNSDGKQEPVEMVEEQLLACCWGRGLRMVQTAFSMLLSGQQFPFILQGLALAAPTAAHLHLLWEEIMCKHLRALLSGPCAGAAACAALGRKYAFSGSSRYDPSVPAIASAGGGNGRGSAEKNTAIAGDVPADINQQLRSDEGQGVRYFAVPVALQKLFCDHLCSVMDACEGNGDNGEGGSGGAARYLFVSGTLGDRGLDLARCLLFLHPTASVSLQQSMRVGLTSDDLVTLALHHKGSLALQQYLRTASYWAAMGRHAGGKSHHEQQTAQGAETTESETAMRMLRATEDRMHELVFSKYGAYVVETLYQVGSVPTKEALLEALLPIYSSLKEQPDSSDHDESLRRHVARKVLTACHVEQYVHRREDWVKLAQRQVHVQRLTWRMMLVG